MDFGAPGVAASPAVLGEPRQVWRVSGSAVKAHSFDHVVLLFKGLDCPRMHNRRRRMNGHTIA
jgi:hypothetical protein